MAPAPLLHCPHFGPCGGCTRLDQPIATQLADKQARAAALLAPWLDGVPVEIELPPRLPRHDRTAILYPAQRVGRRLELGIYRRGTHRVEPIADCRIQHRALTAFGSRAAEMLRALRLPAYDERRHQGVVRAVRARLMPGTNELLVGAIVTAEHFAGRDRLADGLAVAAAGLADDQGRPITLVGVVLEINERRGNALLGGRPVALRGRSWQFDRAAGLVLQVSSGSFYQHHRHADVILFRPALAMLGPVAGLRIVDGYGGVGAFGLRLLRAGAGRATIIESSPSACGDARANLARNELAGGAVLEQSFGAAPLPACDLLVADPPRAGLLAPGAAAVIAAAPPRVLLVSCALDSLARDLQRLAARYRVAAVRLCDLFPHTEHVELLTLLERRE